MAELLRCEHMIQHWHRKEIGDLWPVRWERRKNEDTGRYSAIAVVLCATPGCEEESEVGPRWFEPDHTTLMEWDDEGGCETLDGCWVEPDGRCEHGFPSWLRWKGMI